LVRKSEWPVYTNFAKDCEELIRAVTNLQLPFLNAWDRFCDQAREDARTVTALALNRCFENRGTARFRATPYLVSESVFGVKAWANVYFTPPAANAVPVEVQAGQFAFYFRYPGPDGSFGPIHPDMINEANQNFYGLDTDHDADSKDDVVTAEMAVPVNREIHLIMHSKDVGHSFFVPELRVQQDFVPGMDLSVHFTATKIGRYEIVCTQLCGLGHYNMKAYLSVLSPEDFDAWMKKEKAMQ